MNKTEFKTSRPSSKDIFKRCVSDRKKEILDGRSEIKEGMKNKGNENEFSQSVVEEITEVWSQTCLYSYLAMVSCYLEYLNHVT